MKTLFSLMKDGYSLLFFLIFLFSGYSYASFNSLTGNELDFFPEIEGWIKPGKIEIFTPDTLYEHIDGAAELYLIYGFQELWVAAYTNEKDAYIIVEIYFHNTPEQTFGIYSVERPTRDYYINIGAQGYMILPVLNFFSGNAYVKINSYGLQENNRQVLLAFAEKLASKLDNNPSLPRILDCFPDVGRIVNSEKFIPKDFLGYEFLHFVFTADYADADSKFTIFIIQGEDSTDCEEMLTHYLQFTKHPITQVKQDVYTLVDPYHGEIDVSQKGRYLWGIMGLDDKEKRTDYLAQTEKRLFSAVSKEDDSDH